MLSHVSVTIEDLSFLVRPDFVAFVLTLEGSLIPFSAQYFVEIDSSSEPSHQYTFLCHLRGWDFWKWKASSVGYLTKFSENRQLRETIQLTGWAFTPTLCDFIKKLTQTQTSFIFLTPPVFFRYVKKPVLSDKGIISAYWPSFLSSL